MSEDRHVSPTYEKCFTAQWNYWTAFLLARNRVVRKNLIKPEVKCSKCPVGQKKKTAAG